MKVGKNSKVCKDFAKACGGEDFLVEVGDNCQITEGCRVFTHGGSHVARYKYPDFDVFGKVKIGDWCYIGNNSLIMAGVTIGNHCLVAAGSVVTKSVPDGCVVGGNPASYIMGTDEWIEKNLPYNIGTKGLDEKKKLERLKKVPESKFIKKNTMATE